MRRPATTLLFLMLLYPLVGAAPAQELIAPGSEGALAIADCKYPGFLYVPSDYRRGTRLPLIFFLHGSGGQPTSWPWRSATKGEGYFICGLPYGVQEDGGAGGILSDENTRVAMVEFIDRVRTQIDAAYGVSREHVILSGLSMGGWGVNFYGFHEKARDRYCAYAILAAGPRAPSDFSVAAGKRVLLLNGENDQNLPAANQGKPALEEAGAIVEQVIIPGQGHVPTPDTTDGPLAAWLAGVKKEMDRSNPASAVAWNHLRLDVGQPEVKGPEALASWLAGQPGVEEGREGRPSLLLGVSAARDRKGKATRSAKKSAQMERELFCFPSTCEVGLAARSWECFRFELTDRTKKSHPRLNETMAPVVVLLDEDGALVTVLSGAKLKSKALAAALRAPLDEAAVADLDARAEALRPLLAELKKLEGKRAKLEKDLAKQRRARKPSPKKIAKLEEELSDVDVRRDELLTELCSDAR